MITVDNINSFKKSYYEALESKKEQFVFEGQDVLTNYAKYVIEYWDNNAPKEDRNHLYKPVNFGKFEVVQFARQKAKIHDMKPNQLLRLFADKDYAYFIFNNLNGKLCIGSYVGATSEIEMPLFYPRNNYFEVADNSGNVMFKFQEL